jgi:hypothetical protein
MELNRRTFLKSLMAVAGVAALGLPPVANEELFDEIDLFLEQGGEPAHPTGQYGSVRIGDKWYALHGASVDIHHEPILMDLGSSWAYYRPGPLSWEMTLDLETIDGLNVDTHQDIELEMGRGAFTGTFTGQGLIIGVNPMLYPNRVGRQVTLAGAGPLQYA